MPDVVGRKMFDVYVIAIFYEDFSLSDDLLSIDPGDERRRRGTVDVNVIDRIRLEL